jgi:hypothetical protein
MRALRAGMTIISNTIISKTALPEADISEGGRIRR